MEGLKYKINPFDEIAVEEALRLVAKHGGEVVVVSVGGKEVQEQLRHALAMGATRAIWVNHAGPIDQLGIAALPARRSPSKRSPTSSSSASRPSTTTRARSGQYLAEWLGWAQATFASKEESLESDAEKAKTPALKLSADGKSLTRGARGRRRPATRRGARCPRW